MGQLAPISKNMYDFIKEMQLGNLSSLKQIPEFYVNCVLKFIIHVTRAFAHAHENNIIHGNFNLSRVIAQKIECEDNDRSHVHVHKKHDTQSTNSLYPNTKGTASKESVAESANPAAALMHP